MVFCQKKGENIDFGKAIEAVKNGARISCKGWNGKGQYVELATCISYKNAAGEIVNVKHDAIGNNALAFVGTSGVQLGWLASQAEMLADDWIILERQGLGETDHTIPEKGKTDMIRNGVTCAFRAAQRAIRDTCSVPEKESREARINYLIGGIPISQVLENACSSQSAEADKGENMFHPVKS